MNEVNGGKKQFRAGAAQDFETLRRDINEKIEKLRAEIDRPLG